MAAEIEDISEFEPNDDITQEKLIEQRLTTKETLSFIEYLISNNEMLNLEMATVAIYFRA